MQSYSRRRFLDIVKISSDIGASLRSIAREHVSDTNVFSNAVTASRRTFWGTGGSDFSTMSHKITCLNIMGNIRAMSKIAEAVSQTVEPVSVVGRVEEAYTVTPQNVFAIVEVAGTQYKVTPDDLIVTEKINGVDVNDTVRLNRILMLGSTRETIIGRPYIPEASVTAAVEEQFLDAKVIVFKKRRRKNSRRTNGHRQPLTALRIISVDGIPE